MAIDTTVREIDSARFDELLNIMPPARWVRLETTETFHLCEPLTDTMRSIVVRIGAGPAARFFMFDGEQKQHADRVAYVRASRAYKVDPTGARALEGFETIPGPLGVVYFRVVYLYNADGLCNVAVRIAPERAGSQVWRLDTKAGPWPWEAVTPTEYAGPTEAARDLVKIRGIVLCPECGTPMRLSDGATIRAINERARPTESDLRCSVCVATAVAS